MENQENPVTHHAPKRINLAICGGEHKVVPFEEVEAVSTPPVEYRKVKDWEGNPTDQILRRKSDGAKSISYQPIEHAGLVTSTRQHLAQAGFSIVGESHNLAKEGKRYFGLFEVTHPSRENAERGTIIGLRNAHDKSFPAGLCAGDAPFVCDNLIFTNDVKLARKHTSRINEELDQVIARTLGQLFTFWGGQDQRIDSYKNHDLTNAQVNDLVIRAYQAGAIGKTKVIDVVNQWESSDHVEFWDKNMNSLYNAFTEIYKGNLVALPKRSEALHSVLDAEVGFSLEDFKASEEAQAVEAVTLDSATEQEVIGEVQELEIVGPINGEVPASLYADWDQADR